MHEYEWCTRGARVWYGVVHEIGGAQVWSDARVRVVHWRCTSMEWWTRGARVQSGAREVHERCTRLRSGALEVQDIT